MKLTRDDKIAITNRIPCVQLSYDEILHKKVNADLYIAIPEGERCLLWFTTVDEQSIIYKCSLNSHNDIIDVSIKSAVFDDCLSNGEGTIIEGRSFYYSKLEHFTCLNIFWYKGQDITKSNFKTKLNLIAHLFKNNIRQIAYTKNDIVIGTPVITNSFKNTIDIARTLPYKTQFIQLCNLNRKKSVIGCVKATFRPITSTVFNVRAKLQDDIYELICKDSNDSFYAIAGIQDYKTSAMMNSIFRNIKENQNLDLLEESDEEDEFEDSRENKYVDLKKVISMRCTYNRRFKKWLPTNIVNNAKVDCIAHVRELERNNHRL